MLEWARGSARRRMVQMHLRCVLRRARASTLTAVFWRPIGRAWRSFPVVVDAERCGQNRRPSRASAQEEPREHGEAGARDACDKSPAGTGQRRTPRGT